jgi:hypothetical protein
VIIDSGTIEASSGFTAIGGEWGCDGGTIEINGGTVTATFYADGTGIGGGTGGTGGDGGIITINGGMITTDANGRGIGGGYGYDYGGGGGVIIINGGTVNALAGGIGGGKGDTGGAGGAGGAVTINGGTVAVRGISAPPIGPGTGGAGPGSPGTITIRGGNVYVGSGLMPNPQPRNDSGEVYRVTGTLDGLSGPGPAALYDKPVTAGAINGTACDTERRVPQTGAYGIHGMMGRSTPSNAQIFLWLPAGPVSALRFTVEGREYSASGGFTVTASNANTVTLYH